MKLLQNVRVAIRVVILTGLVALALAGTVNLARADETSMPSATPTPWPPSPTPEGWVEPEPEPYVPTGEELQRIELDRYIWRLWYQTPGVAGVWTEVDEPGVYYVGLTSAADKKTIVDGFAEYGVTDVRVRSMKYTYVELCEAANYAIIDYAKAYTFPVLVADGVNERENCVNVEIYSKAPEEAQIEVMQALAERFGDMIRFEFVEYLPVDTDTSESEYRFVGWAEEDKSVTTVYKVVYSFKSESKETSKAKTTPNYVFLLAAVVFAAILAEAILLRRWNARVRMTADGSTVVTGRTYTDAEIEALAKSAARDVSEAGRRRIFEAYERER
jgi:SHS2 domain-containing protein